MKSIEHDQHSTTRGRKGQKTLLCEAIWLNFAVLESPYLILVILSITVQNGEIDVRRSLRNGVIMVISLEQGCPALIRFYGACLKFDLP